jgi:hypothetical protein
MSRGALTWFETIWSYDVKAIDYFLDENKIKFKKNEKFIGIWGVFLVLVESL